MPRSNPLRSGLQKGLVQRSMSFADYTSTNFASRSRDTHLRHLVIRPFNLVFVFTNPWSGSSHAVISLTQENDEGLWDYIYRLLNNKNNRGKQEGGCYLVYALLDYVVSVVREWVKRRWIAMWMC